MVQGLPSYSRRPSGHYWDGIGSRQSAGHTPGSEGWPPIEPALKEEQASDMDSTNDILHASNSFERWMKALKDRAALQTQEECVVAFRAVLHRLRECMTPPQVATPRSPARPSTPSAVELAVADALPPLPRGIFLAGWRPGHALPSGAPTTFLHDVREDLSSHHVPDSIVADLFFVLDHQSGSPASETMRDQLPDQLRSLWP